MRATPRQLTPLLPRTLRRPGASIPRAMARRSPSVDYRGNLVDLRCRLQKKLPLTKKAFERLVPSDACPRPDDKQVVAGNEAGQVDLVGILPLAKPANRSS